MTEDTTIDWECYDVTVRRYEDKIRKNKDQRKYRNA
jgi:hypothetical protein